MLLALTLHFLMKLNEAHEMVFLMVYYAVK